MGISSLYFTDVGPFEEIAFEFDDQINVFTGPNNSGKSTVLWVLGELLVYPFSIPLKIRSVGSRQVEDQSIRRPIMNEEFEGDLPTRVEFLRDMFEEIGYTCFVPAQRHSSGVRPTGTTLVSDIEDIVDADVERIINERPSILEGPRTRRTPPAAPARVSVRRSLVLGRGDTLCSVTQHMVSDDAVTPEDSRP